MKKRLSCNHEEESGKKCTFPCLEYEDLKITIISRHRDRSLREVRHVNNVSIGSLIDIALKQGDGEKLIKLLKKKISEFRLTEGFKLV